MLTDSSLSNPSQPELSKVGCVNVKEKYEKADKREIAT